MLWFKLASHLGMSVARAQQEISAAEFTYWIAFLKYYGLDNQGWEQAAMICSVSANIAGAKTVPLDFMPVEKPPQKKAQTTAEMLKVMEAMFNG